MAKKEKTKEVKTTDITKIVKPTEKPKDPDKPTETSKPEPVSNISEGVTKKPKETKPQRKLRKDKGKTHEKIILGTTTAPQTKKEGWSTSMKVGFTLGTLTIFAVAFYAMYKALEKYRKEKKEVEEADTFIDEENDIEFVEDEPEKTEETDNT